MYILVDNFETAHQTYEILGYTETLEDAKDIALISEMTGRKLVIEENLKLLKPSNFKIPEFTTVDVYINNGSDRYECCFMNNASIEYNKPYHDYDGSIHVYIKEPTRDSIGLIPAEDILNSAKEKGIEILKKIVSIRDALLV